MYDQILPLLPGDLRRQVLAVCRPELLAHLSALQAEVNLLSIRRARQVGDGRYLWGGRRNLRRVADQLL